MFSFIVAAIDCQSILNKITAYRKATRNAAVANPNHNEANFQAPENTLRCFTRPGFLASILALWQLAAVPVSHFAYVEEEMEFRRLDLGVKWVITSEDILNKLFIDGEYMFKAPYEHIIILDDYRYEQMPISVASKYKNWSRMSDLLNANPEPLDEIVPTPDNIPAIIYYSYVHLFFVFFCFFVLTILQIRIHWEKQSKRTFSFQPLLYDTRKHFTTRN